MAFGFTYTLPTISGTHTDFPVVLKTADFPSAAVDGGANSLLNGGGNLRAYTDDTKATQLPLEVVRLVTGGTPDCEVWVKVPSAATGSTIYLEADDTETSQPAVTNAFGRNAVWADYLRVYHLNDSSSVVDATGIGGSATVNGSPTTTTGPLGWGTCIDFDGSDDWIEIASTQSFITADPVLVQAIIKPDVLPANHLIVGCDSTASPPGFGLTLWADNEGFNSGRTNILSADARTGQGTRLETATNSVTAGTTVTIHYVNDSSGTQRAYFDGNQDVNTATGEVVATSAGPVRIGDGPNFTVPFNGPIQEVRYRDAPANLDDWIATESDMFGTATAWGTVGDWEEPGGGITGSGSPQAETATSSGTGIRTITGDGTPTATTATASGEGTVGNIITGSGDIQADTSTTSGIGERIVTGSGIPVAATATASGVGTRVITGTSTSVADTATSTGEGGVGITGSGSPVADTATVSGVGTRAITGTGATQSTTAIASGAGERAVTGSGSPQATAATVSAVGERVITATAVTQAATATATAAGERIVTATATVQAAVATSGGSGAVEGAVAGSGAGQVDTATVTGAGTRTVAASAVATANTATTSGAGTRIVTATAAVQADVATTAAQGGAQQDGSAVVQATAATASGAGTRAIVGTGAVIAGMATAAGAGVPGIAGGAGVQADTAATSGAGVRTISGAGATQAQTALVAAAGVLVVTFPERQRGLGGKIIVGRRGRTRVR